MKIGWIYSLFAVLLFLVLVSFASDFFGDNLIVTPENKCTIKELGTTIYNDKKRDVFSYCFDSVVLNHVMVGNHISYPKLISNLKETECLWDGGTCFYIGRKYQIISCKSIMGTGNIVITSKNSDKDQIYHMFCDSNNDVLYKES